MWDFHFYVAKNWPEDPICLHFPGCTSTVSTSFIKLLRHISGLPIFNPEIPNRQAYFLNPLSPKGGQRTCDFLVLRVSMNGTDCLEYRVIRLLVWRTIFSSILLPYLLLHYTILNSTLNSFLDTKRYFIIT